MGKALLLYLLVLASMGIAVWQPTLAWLAMVMFFLGLPIGAIWLWRSEGRSIRDLGLRRAKPWVRDFGNGFLIGLILPMVLTLFLAITGSLTLVPTTWPVSLLVGILGGVLVGVLKTALTVSIEEFIFRGYFLQRFRLDLGIQRAVLLSSLLFALAHAPSMLGSRLPLMPMLIGLFSWFVFGVALSLGFLHTGSSLWFPWGLHYAYNLGYSLVGFCIAAVYNTPTAIAYSGPIWWIGDPAWAPESGLLGLLLEVAILAAVWLVARVRRRGSTETSMGVNRKKDNHGKH